MLLVQVATNALLERKGERCALVTSKGFKDLLHIGNQSRPFIFDLEIRVPAVLYEQAIEVDEQVATLLSNVLNAASLLMIICRPCCWHLDKWSFDSSGAFILSVGGEGGLQVILPLGDVADKRSGQDPQQDKKSHPPLGKLIKSVTGETVEVRKAPDLAAVRSDLKVNTAPRQGPYPARLHTHRL